MPKLGGCEVRDQIVDKKPDLPVLFSSVYSRLHRDFVLGEGAEIIKKPFSPRQLLEKVRELLDTAS